jgi:hypothetical protein
MSRILSYNHHEPEYKNIRKEIALSTVQLEQLTGTYKSAQMGALTIKRENNVLIATLVVRVLGFIRSPALYFLLKTVTLHFNL